MIQTYKPKKVKKVVIKVAIALKIILHLIERI